MVNVTAHTNNNNSHSGQCHQQTNNNNSHSGKCHQQTNNNQKGEAKDKEQNSTVANNQGQENTNIPIDKRIMSQGSKVIKTRSG